MTGTILRITRKADLNYSGRRLAVMVDGQRVGFVRIGKTQEFQLPPGPHEVWVSLDWSRSPVHHISGDLPSVCHLEARLRGDYMSQLMTALFTPKSLFDLVVLEDRQSGYYRPASR